VCGSGTGTGLNASRGLVIGRFFSIFFFTKIIFVIKTVTSLSYKESFGGASRGRLEGGEDIRRVGCHVRVSE
jgi:hypothetical protein